MKKQYIIAIAFILSSIMVKAQASGPNKITPDQLSKIRLNSNYDREIRYMFNLLAKKTHLEKPSIDTVAVNKYLTETPFAKGHIYYKGKKMPQEYQLRHNALKDIIEIHNEKEPDMVLRNPRISCKIGDSKYVYTKINKGKEASPGYLKEVYAGKNTYIYEKEVLIYKNAKRANTTLTTDIKARYVKYNYIFKKDKGETIATKLPTKKTSFLNNFKKEYRNDVKNFMKENKIDLNKVDDVVKTYKYVEQHHSI
ncbi:MAG: hypothetical protein ACPGUU_01405 [Flavobacteriaceae bacterium]